MVDYSEEEQIERLRAWLREYGPSTLLAIALGVAALVGWRAWEGSEKEARVGASMLYEQMLEAAQQAQQSADSQAQAKISEARANTLIEQYPDGAYADFARLLLARLAVEDQDYGKAVTLLEEVVGQPASDMIRYTALLRLARVQAQTDNTEAALALLDKRYPAAFQAQALELKGDVLRGQGDLDGARAAYSAALEKMDDDQFRELVQMKLDDLVPAS